MGSRLRIQFPNILSICLRQDRLRSRREVEAITAVRLDEFLIMVRVPGSLFCDISAGVDSGKVISSQIGLLFLLALAEPLVPNCTP